MSGVDNNWTDDIEQLVKQWAEQAAELDSSYDSQSQRQKIYYYLLSIPSIIFQAILTGLTIYNIIQNVLAVKIVIVVCVVISTALLSIMTLFSFNSSSQASGNISAKYKRLKNRLESELKTERKYRMDGLIFKEYARRKYGRLSEMSPDLISDIKMIFSNLFVGKREPVANIQVASIGLSYASAEDIANALALDHSKQAVLDQFIENNNEVVADGSSRGHDRVHNIIQSA